MATPTSAAAVVAALSGNAFVTILKFIAFFLSGSGAMLSEAIHSVADTGNQLLLYVGLKRADKEADDRFHYGYGGERFVFGILSAAGIFFVGCGITLFHGISSLVTPHTPHLTATTFGVLGASFLIEGSVLLYAVRRVRGEKGELPFFTYVRRHADPATVAILLEDSAAVLGLLLAAGGIYLSYVTGNPMFDAIGSIVVGLLLGLVAFYLVRENRELLLGRAVPEGIEDKFKETILDQPSVRSVRDVKTRQLTPEAFLFKAEITLDPDFMAEQLGKALPADPADLHKARTLRRFVSATTDLIATQVASIELAVVAAIPQARHIDLEIAHPEKYSDDEELA